MWDTGDRRSRRQSVEHPVEMPRVGDALQLVLASVFEDQSRAHGEVFDRGTDQNLPGACERADPGGDVHREAADAVTGEFDLPGVASGADAQAELADGPPIAWAQRTARAGPSKVASRPSPAESI